MKKLLILSLSALFFITSCCKEKEENIEETIINYSGDTLLRSEYLAMATLWFQKSAENRALFYQTYAFAKIMLDKNLKESKSEKPKAIITDIDETVLNNSPYNAGLIETGMSYDKESWAVWVNEKRAKALPGALDFCNFVKEKGVEVFYVSNRSDERIDETLENMLSEKFPFADKEHVFLKTESSNKTDRRNSILETHDVILLLGDNLRDFDEIFGSRGEDLGFNIVDENKDNFGTKFIVFPNPIYGEWEKAVYKGDFSKSDEEKRKMRNDAMDK